MNNGFHWENITHVLLDLDGTLLDRDFDDHFWLETVPGEYAKKQGIPLSKARERLLEVYHREAGTLNWFDIDFWGSEFGLDIRALQEREGDNIRTLPNAVAFLQFVKGMGKPLHLLTDAHPGTLATKFKYVPLEKYFDSVLSAFDLGCIKQERCFWEEAASRIGFHPSTSLFIDDRPQVAQSARKFGVGYVFIKAGSCGSRPPEYHPGFFPVIDFREIIEN